MDVKAEDLIAMLKVQRNANADDCAVAEKDKRIAELEAPAPKVTRANQRRQA